MLNSYTSTPAITLNVMFSQNTNTTWIKLEKEEKIGTLSKTEVLYNILSAYV